MRPHFFMTSWPSDSLPRGFLAMHRRSMSDPVAAAHESAAWRRWSRRPLVLALALQPLSLSLEQGAAVATFASAPSLSPFSTASGLDLELPCPALPPLLLLLIALALRNCEGGGGGVLISTTRTLGFERPGRSSQKIKALAPAARPAEQKTNDARPPGVLASTLGVMHHGLTPRRLEGLPMKDGGE
jgi:hypothetical protein